MVTSTPSTPRSGRRPRPTTPGKAVTLHAVAKAAGVSTATVSKALNGLAVSPENFERVYAAAKELGYVPNLAARAMRSSRTMTIGMVANFDGHPRSELLGVFQTMIGQMEARGYSVLLSVVRNGGVDLDTLLRRFVAHRVDGLFYWNARPSAALDLYRASNVPVVAVGFRDRRLADLPFVTVDGVPAFKAACDDLIALGHSRVAEMIVNRAEPLHRLFPRRRGLRWTDITTGPNQEDVRAAIQAQLLGDGAPTAVIATTPTVTQILGAAEELGIRVPDDLSVIALSDPEDAALLRTPLSAISTDYARLGHASAQVMLDALAGATVTDVLLADSTEYIPRASTGPARRS